MHFSQDKNSLNLMKGESHSLFPRYFMTAARQKLRKRKLQVETRCTKYL